MSTRPEAEHAPERASRDRPGGLFSFEATANLRDNESMGAKPTTRELFLSLGWVEEIDPVDHKPVYYRPFEVVKKLTDVVPGSRALIAGGMSAVCVTCVHMRRAVDVGSRKCGETCSGPLGGQGFPKYEGPIKGGLVKMCFVCGAESKRGVAGVGWQEPLGVCMIHEPWLKKSAGQGAP